MTKVTSANRMIKLSQDQMFSYRLIYAPHHFWTVVEVQDRSLHKIWYIHAFLFLFGLMLVPHKQNVW